MLDNNNLSRVTSYIFTNKINNKHKIIPLNKVNNTLGPTRVFPAAIKEWTSAIYSFNKGSVKLLTIKNKMLNKIIKAYFNLYFSRDILNSNTSFKSRRLSTNRIFVSKAEVKHTSTKAVITLYTYNEERRIIIRKLRRLEYLLFPSNVLSRDNVNNEVLSLQDKIKKNLLEKPSIELEKVFPELSKIIYEQEITLKDVNKLTNKHKTANVIQQEALVEYSQTRYLEKELIAISYYNALLSLNKSKFENSLISGLRYIVEKIYNKEIEFNIVDLKALYLNSDLFTQAISLKLNNRDNKLLTTLRSALHMVKLPRVNRVREKFNHVDIKNLWVNKVKDIIMSLPKKHEDGFNKLLLDIYPNNKLSILINKNYLEQNLVNEEKKSNDRLINIVLASLKNKEMAGIRLEAKGRLTRRFTASRSVFKVKWKGTLKNLDSSYRGMSSTMLRGHVKSNVQFTSVSERNRNGSYGIKGWVSSK